MGPLRSCWNGTSALQPEEITSKRTSFMSVLSIKTVPHPPYSPDLAPCDFWLFPKLKEKLRGCHYETIEEMTCPYKRTSMGPCRSCWNGTTSALLPEKIISKGTRVSCVYYQ